MKPKQLNSKQAYEACRNLHAQIVKHDNNGCEGAGILPGDCTPQLQCAHIVPKKAARWAAWSIYNGWTLYAYHHRMIDRNQALWLRLVKATNTEGQARYLQHIHEKGNPHENRVAFLRFWVSGLLHYARVNDIPVEVPKYVLRWHEHYYG